MWHSLLDWFLCLLYIGRHICCITRMQYEFRQAIWHVNSTDYWVLCASGLHAAFALYICHWVRVLAGNEESTWLIDVLVYIAGTHYATNLLQASTQCLLERNQSTRTLMSWSAALQCWPLLRCLCKDLMLRFNISQLSLLGWAMYYPKWQYVLTICRYWCAIYFYSFTRLGLFHIHIMWTIWGGDCRWEINQWTSQ